VEFMKTAEIGKEPAVDPSWTWKTQLDNWKGNCQARNIMQSPINISPAIMVTDGKSTKAFSFAINFASSEFLVVKRGTEILAQFTQNAGMFSIIYSDITIQFQPVAVYFRFPAEHTFNGVRDKNSGEMIIRLNELQPDQVRFN